jgi:prepilin-type N-terminal cleavage/methylation domain-containing protein
MQRRKARYSRPAEPQFRSRGTEDGFTLIEVMVASVVLVTGLLALFGMLELGSRTTAKNRLRQAGTSLAREMVEDIRGLSYSQLLASSLAATLQPLVTGSTVAGTNLKVTRSPYTFSVSFSACSLDDPGDGTGDHSNAPSSGGSWCPDVAASGTTDSNPDDYKRVSVTVTPTGTSTTPQIQQTILVYGRDVNGLAVTCLSTNTTCPGTNQVYTSGSSQSFNITTNTQATAIQWLVNGNPPPSSQVPTGANDPYTPGGATSSFIWSFPAADGTYTIAGRGFDANGNSGTTSSLQVVLNRHQATPPATISAGWDNLINQGANGGGVDIQWVPSIDKDILYYQVWHQYGAGAASVVAACSHVTGTSCTDLTAPSPNPPATPATCLNPPQTYATTNFYWVVGVDTDPVTGQPRVSTATSPKVDANICDHQPNAPTGLAGVLLNGTVTLNWVAPVTPDPDAGDSLLGWRVYRWPTGQSPQFPGSRLALVGTLNSSGQPLVSYADSSADPLGVTQTYCVTSVDTHMNESPCSLVVTA